MRRLVFSLVPLAALSAAMPVSDKNPQISLRDAMQTVLFAGVEAPSDDTPGEPPTEGGGSASTYCSATLNSFGTAGSISHVGSLDLTAGTFGLTVSGVSPIASSWGMFTYGLVQTNVPFGNGILCISPFSPGIHKMPTQPLGTGTVTMTMASFPTEFAGFTSGSTWNYQFWYRDPPAGGANFNLSNGLRVTFGP